MLALKRMRERSSVFGALLVVAAILSSIGVGLVGYLAEAETAGARIELADAAGVDGGLEVSLPSSVGSAIAQDDAVRALLARVFSDSDGPLPLRVNRTLAGAKTVGWHLDAPEAEEQRATVYAVPDLAEVATLASGDWPDAPDEVSIQADAAVRFDLPAGSRLRLGDLDVTVTGTWLLDDELDPRWLGEGQLTAGTDGSSVVPFVADEEALPTIGVESRTRWAITIDTETIEANDLSIIVDAWRLLASTARADPALDTGGFDQSGRLARTLGQLESEFNGVRAVGPIALLIVGAIGLLTLVQLAGVLASLRSAEVLLLWARGATVTRLAISTAIEAAGAAIIGAAIGSAAAAVALVVLYGDSDVLARLGMWWWTIPAVVALAGILTFTLRSLVATRSISRRERLDESGRLRRFGTPGVVVLVVLAAAISTWQLLLYGSPVVPSRGGGSDVDPVAVVAPALALLAIVLLAVTALPLLGPILERAARRSTGYAATLATRTLSRRIQLATIPIVLAALAFGQTFVAATYAQTWENSFGTAQELRAGARLKISGNLNALTPEILAAAQGADGVDYAAPVSVDTTLVGAEQVALLAMTPGAFTSLAAGSSKVVDREYTADALDSGLVLPVIPAGATSLTITAAATALPSELRVFLVDEFGFVRTVTLADTDGEYTAELADTGEQRILGIESDYTTADPTATTPFDITGIRTPAGDVDAGTQWIAQGVGERSLGLAVASAPAGPGYTVAGDAGTVRLMPMLADGSDEITPPVVVTADLAERSGLYMGDVIPILLDPRAIPVSGVIAGIVPVVPGPGGESGLLVDIRVIEALQLRLYDKLPAPDQLWIGADDETAAAASLRGALPANVRVESIALDPARDILGAASAALWVGAAGAGLLAAVGIGAVTAAQIRSRRGEVTVLRALGLSPGRLGGMRRAELAVVLGIGAVVGMLAGAAVSALMIPTVARAAVPDPYPELPTALAIAAPALALAVGLLVAAFAAVVLAYGARVARQARHTTGREELT